MEDDIFTGEAPPTTSESPVPSLPTSSTDLAVPSPVLLPLVSVFKVLSEKFDITDISFEEFCSGVAHHDHCSITNSVHIALLDGLLAKELESSDSFSSYDLLSLEKLDDMTWPAVLRLYLDHTASPRKFDGDYYSLTTEQRVDILLELTNSVHSYDKSSPSIFNTEPLGTDAASHKYWFLKRRLFVGSGTQTLYYSSKDKLDELLEFLKGSDENDKKVHDAIKEDYFDYVDQMNETLVDFVFAYKTSQTRSLQSPTKYSGITYGDQTNSTVLRKDIENMPLSSLLSVFKQGNEENFTFGTDKTYLKYKNKVVSNKLDVALSIQLNEIGRTVKETLTWKSTTPDQIKLLRNTLLNTSSNIPKYFMHDAWPARCPGWESTVLKAGTAHHLAACLAYLESHIRPVIFTPSWTKIDEAPAETETPVEAETENETSTSGEQKGTEPEKMETNEENPSEETESKDETEESTKEEKDETAPVDSVEEKKENIQDAENKTEEKMDVEKEESSISPEEKVDEEPDKPESRRKGSPRKSAPGEGWSYQADASSSSPKSRDKDEMSERLTKIVNRLQCTKGSGDPQSKKVISMPHGFKKIISPEGKVMFALPPGAKILRQKSVTQVILSANSLNSGAPTTIQVIPSDQNKENKSPFGVHDSNQRNIVLSKEVGQSLLKRPDLNIKGNVTLKRRNVVTSPKKENPDELLQRLFHSWGSQEIVPSGDHTLPEHKQRKLGRSGGLTMLHGYLYNTSKEFCEANSQNRWRRSLRGSVDVAHIATLISMLYSHITWTELSSLKVQINNQYNCDDTNLVQRVIVDSRTDKNDELVKQYKIVVMKQKKEDEELLQIHNPQIKSAMEALEEGIHDLWVSQDMVTLSEAYTYLFNQDKIKCIESAKILEEKKKSSDETESDSLLPQWKSDDSADKKYFVDSEISAVVRRVVTNIVDRVVIEDIRDTERKGKKKKAKKSMGRQSGRSNDEREQIKYLSKLDILLGRRKEQLKKTFFKKRRYLAHMLTAEIKFDEEEGKRIADKIRREEEEELALIRKKSADADRKKRDKEKKIKKAQERIEKKLQKLQSNVNEYKDTNVSMKKPKSPGRANLKSPKNKKSSIRIEPHLHKPVYKNKLQPKTKFKFPPKKPVVKKSTGKLSLTPNRSRQSSFGNMDKILGKRKVRYGDQPYKRLCIEIVPVKLTKRKRGELEQRLSAYQRSIARNLTTDDISHPTINFHKRRSAMKLKQKTTGSAADKNSIRERLQKLRKIASAKNRGNEVLAKLLMKQELVKKLAASQKPQPEESTSEADKRSVTVIGSGVMQHHKDQTNKSAPKKKDTLYCICKRPYDHTRFYIGCDVCSNWFHGKCVAISPSMARNMSGYTCEECKNSKTSTAATTAATTAAASSSGAAGTEGKKPAPLAEPEGDLFCICRTPYNQYSFYIGCDNCQEWYHGTCVGISEMEAEKIEVYICDRCKQQQGREEPKLTHIQIAGLIKILRELQMHKMSWPFREPGKSETETETIKEPMDLSTIHKKFQKKHYPKLTLFVKDVLRVFSNARQVYSEDSQRGRCADTLERYFVAKLNEFKLRHGLS